MNKTYIALGNPEKFANLGNFNVTIKDDIMDVYYNLDLGDHRASMFDVSSGIYKDLEKIHHSFHYSGQGHLKEKLGGRVRKHLIGHISDGSVLNDPDMNPLILGVESFFFDLAAATGLIEQNVVFLQPPTEVKQYSILWLLMPASASKTIHPRWLYVNLWGTHESYYTFSTAALTDIAITSETQTILTINDWEIRALFLKKLLPVLTQGVTLVHPKGMERPWRAWASLDAHLPLSQMVNHEAQSKRPLITTEPPIIPEEAKTPWTWVKKQKVET